MPSLFVYSFALILLSLLFTFRRRGAKPPGPFRFPLVGNAFQIPRTGQLEVFSNWAKRYGELTYLEAVGQPILVLNSIRAVDNLLYKRSAIYSDRPQMVMARKLSKMGGFTVFLQYGEELRRHRKLFAAGFSKTALPGYYPLQQAAARELVCNLLANPNSDPFTQVQFRIGAIIIRVVFGHQAQSPADELLVMGNKFMKSFGQASEAGRWLVDSLPFLQYIPRWMPGSEFLGLADQYAKDVRIGVWEPWRRYQLSVENGMADLPNLMNNVLSSEEYNSAAEEESLRWAVASIFGGGLDTNVATVLFFLVFMICHPEVQKRAQAELDAVIGIDRLPTIYDRKSLPYIRSVITEVMRLWPVVPFSVPHAISEDDIYDGYHLKKGTLVLINVWHILHDPANFPDPWSFNPDRYSLKDSEMDKVNALVWGFSRRVCPGRDFAEGTVFATVVTTLATCDILPALDVSGNRILPELNSTSGLIVFPERYRCTLKPRSQKAHQLLTQ